MRKEGKTMNPQVLSIVEEPNGSLVMTDSANCDKCDGCDNTGPGCDCYRGPCDCDGTPCDS